MSNRNEWERNKIDQLLLLIRMSPLGKAADEAINQILAEHDRLATENDKLSAWQSNHRRLEDELAIAQHKLNNYAEHGSICDIPTAEDIGAICPMAAAYGHKTMAVLTSAMRQRATSNLPKCGHTIKDLWCMKKDARYWCPECKCWVKKGEPVYDLCDTCRGAHRMTCDVEAGWESGFWGMRQAYRKGWAWCPTCGGQGVVPRVKESRNPKE